MVMDMTDTLTDHHATVLDGTTNVNCLLLLASGKDKLSTASSIHHTGLLQKDPLYKFELSCCFEYKEHPSKHECINRSPKERQ
jgi:hypothetical protein